MKPQESFEHVCLTNLCSTVAEVHDHQLPDYQIT